MYGHTLTHVSMQLSHIETDTAVKRHCVRIQQDIQCIQVYAYILYITYTRTHTHKHTHTHAMLSLLLLD